MSCSINLKDLSYKKNGKLLCNSINLRLSHKEKIAIVGPNGSGKTTFLNILAGLEDFDSGHLELFHNRIESKKDFAPLRGMIGYLFQDSNNQFLSPVVIDDVAFSLLSNGMPKEDAMIKARMTLEDLGIPHLSDKIVYNLSGGEKKLVALAGVLVCEPKLMLLDEPTNGLDLDMQLRLVDILKSIDKSIIIVSHDREFVDSIVDKVYTIKPSDKGSILVSD